MSKTNKKETKPTTPSKATKGSSLAKLKRMATSAVKKAHESNPAMGAIEADAMVSLQAVRDMCGTEQNGNLSVFGNRMHGMSGRLDQALMKHDITDFATILAEVAKGENHARRSAPTDHIKLVTHALNHLKRCSGNGINSAKNFAKPLANVGMNHRVDELSNLMAPILLCAQEYSLHME